MLLAAVVWADCTITVGAAAVVSRQLKMAAPEKVLHPDHAQRAGISIRRPDRFRVASRQWDSSSTTAGQPEHPLRPSEYGRGEEIIFPSPRPSPIGWERVAKGRVRDDVHLPSANSWLPILTLP
jgi:hypothetical protein